ncbi:MAG: hypothetical protein JWP64_661 [Pseudonocardia sp.]|nr:hypothetical protein [Pseudonocardia sp.]
MGGPQVQEPGGSGSTGSPRSEPVTGPDLEPDPCAEQAHVDSLRTVHAELVRLEGLLCGGRHPVSGADGGIARAARQVHLPAWQRVTRGENRWPVAAVIVIAIGLQLALPDQLVLQSRWLLPGLELALLVALVIASPSRLERESTVLRAGSLALAGLLSLANAWSAALLVLGLVSGSLGQDAGPLLATGAAIWLTNIIAFAVWYWEFDRGGPVARALARRSLPDFQFVQMQSPDLAHPDWEPGFVDYLYLSFTNATAFSPTDTMPLTRWAKLTMLAQSLVSLITVALVVARAVNILK